MFAYFIVADHGNQFKYGLIKRYKTPFGVLFPCEKLAICPYKRTGARTTTALAITKRRSLLQN
jgi:hypothetical protein